MISTLTRLVAGATLALALTACLTANTTIIGVTITGGNRTLAQGSSITLAAIVHTTNGRPSTVSWTSSNPTVATIDAGGTLTGLTPGTSTITATSNNNRDKSDTITLTVDSGPMALTHQFGTDGSDIANGVASDADGTVYATGRTYGALEGANAGGADAFIRSYDKDDTLRWTRQFGTSSSDIARGVATDADGNVYATGDTGGALEGANAGSLDAFIRSYDKHGALRWTRQFGTSSTDVAHGIAADAGGNVYATGHTFGALEGSNAGGADAFIRSYDKDGNLRWTRQFGTNSNDVAFGIATDAHGNVYATGDTFGALEGANAGGWDAFIRSYDADGNHRWTRQFGTNSNDTATGVATDINGNVYATGYTLGDLEGANAGSEDAFIRSYDQDGALRWTRQFGISSDDAAYGVATDADGNVYTTGRTKGGLEGANVGSTDAFIRSYDKDGTLRWTRQFGTSRSDIARGVATDVDGNVYAAGYTEGAFGGANANAGGEDAFIRKYSP